MGPQANHRRAPRPARHSFEVSRDPRGSRPWIQPTLSARRWPVPCDRARHCGMPRWRLPVRRPLARTGQCVPSASGLRSDGAVGRHEGGVWAVHELPLNEGGGSADHRGVDLNRLLRHVVEVGASDLHLKIGQPPIVRRDGTLRPARGLAAARVGTARRGRADRGRVRPAPPRRVSRERRARYRLPAGRPAALPRERVPPARRDLVRIPRDPERRPDLRAPPAPARRAATGRVPPGPDPRRPAPPVRGRRRRSRRWSATSTGRVASTSSRSRTRSRSSTTDEGCIVNQREVGLDTDSFDQALRRALRQDPDVILIGELRDTETAETALQAAESGHLVLSTMHTIDAAETIRRMIEFFPPVKHSAGSLDPRRRPVRRGQPAPAASHRTAAACRRSR